MSARIAVLGAGGHTGRLVVEALRRRAAEVVALTRRDAEAGVSDGPRLLDAVPRNGVDASDPSSVRAALAGCDGVVNLAGPFLRTGLAPVLAARDVGIPYVDTTGEQAFMAQARGVIRATDAPVVNALAYEYAFGDLAARVFFPKGGEALHVLYRNRGAQASAGTKKSILRVMGAPTLAYEDGSLVRVGAARFVRTFETAEGDRTGISFAGGEVLTVPTHTPFRTVRTYVASSPANARRAKWLAPLARVALRGPVLRAAERFVDARHAPPSNERARGEVHLVAQPGGAHVVVMTPDPYVATAEAAAEGIVRLVGRRAGGVMAPAVAFDARSFLAAMEEAMPGFRVAPFTRRGPKE
jgi:short subunit dehydrogenase-like uncharacterized protein